MRAHQNAGESFLAERLQLRDNWNKAIPTLVFKNSTVNVTTLGFIKNLDTEMPKLRGYSA